MRWHRGQIMKQLEFQIRNECVAGQGKLDVAAFLVQQRARALHLKSGDSNTRFFHNKAS